MAYVTSRDTLVIKIHYAGARRHWDASHYFASFGRLKIWRLKQRPHYTVVMLNNLLGLAHSPALIYNACDLQPAGMPSGDVWDRWCMCASVDSITLCTLSTSGTNFRRPFPVVTSAHCGSVRSPSPCHHFTARPSTEHYLLVKCWRIDLLRIQFPGQSLDCVGSGFSL